MGTSASSEPLNSFYDCNAIMICDLLIVLSSFFMTAPLEMVTLTTSWIYLKGQQCCYQTDFKCMPLLNHTICRKLDQNRIITRRLLQI